MASLDHFMDWLAVQYISALNIIHCMHDKYSYEAALMVSQLRCGQPVTDGEALYRQACRWAVSYTHLRRKARRC